MKVLVRSSAQFTALFLGLVACASAPDRGSAGSSASGADAAAPDTRRPAAPAAAQPEPTPATAVAEPAQPNPATAPAEPAAPIEPTEPTATTATTAAAPAPDAPIVLAHLDGDPITLADAMAQFERSHMGHGQMVRTEASVRELIGRVAEERLFEREARDLGLFDDKDVLGAVDERRWELALQRYWNSQIDELAKVTDAEVDAFYEKTDMILKASLMVAATADEAADLRRRVLGGEDFGDLAQARSIHPSRTFGGLFSVVRRGDFDPALEAAAFALETPGTLTEVVATREGFAFVRLEERILNTERPRREVALPQIRNVLENRRKEELREATLTRLIEKHAARVDAALATPAAVLGEGRDDAVVATALGETLTLKGLRESLDLDRLRAATEPRAAEVVLAIARQWAAERGARREVETLGLREVPEVRKACADYQEDLALGLLYETFVYKGIDPDDAALRAYYQANVATGFTQPPEVRLAYVVVRTAEEAADVLKRLQAGEDFGQVATAVSIDPRSRVHGGRIGWVRPTELMPAVEEKAFSMKVDETAGPIETESGFFVLRVLERREAAVVPYEQSRAAARKRLVKELRLKAYDDWAVRLRARAVLELDADGIARATRQLEAEAVADAEAKAKARLEAGPPAAGGAKKPDDHP
ncbi:MAG: peptidylprolyl isomerase [Planctomycetota bacterium]|nr:peptidylprolyl isomerase [Planctomycetota bacterium]